VEAIMSDKIRRFDPAIQRRPAAFRGPRQSEDWTDSWDEIINDLQELSNQWNLGILPLVSTLPDGDDDSSVNVFVNGLDARTCYVDSSVTSSSDPSTYYHSSSDRPKTIYEALGDIYDYMDDVAEDLQADLATIVVSAALTTEQKARIGMNIFDSTQSSDSTSLDGKSERNRLNLIQVGTDLYGATFSLDNDGTGNLTNTVKDMVDALLSIHGGNWDDDISLIHSGIVVTQTSVGPSATVNDSFAGATTTLQDDLNQIRTRIKAVAGGATWTTTLPALYVGGASDVKTLLDSTAGSAAKSATNPWGYHYDDVNGLETVLDAIQTFTGQDTHTDDTPDYTSTTYVANGDPLESSISRCDEILTWAADPTVVFSGEHFRRLESAIIGSAVTVTHNNNSWPQVEVIQITPSVTVSGHLPYYVQHSSLDEFNLVFVDRNNGIVPSGVIQSGIVLSLW
jgi:hypothetical protein